ncbi:hypothetical protein [Spiroplasma endosymbiont of Ammophila pubescens]|uniref:hypothetical protein n=1 Tax=Spiroplasma endosymbiont of Ammophila pubescens TaxID=3066315 RepID=UPI0032B0F3AE
MNTIKNLYIVFYTDNADTPNQGKVVKVFTDSELARKYLLTKVNLNGKKLQRIINEF